MINPSKHFPSVSAGADHKLTAVAEDADTSPTGGAASNTPAHPPPADRRGPTSAEVFARWAVDGTDNAGQLRYLVGQHLRNAPPDISLAAAAPTDAHAPSVHLAWHRLAQSGLLALIDDWRQAAHTTSELQEAAWAARVCDLVDRTVRDDPTAALGAVHGAAPPGTPLPRRFALLEETLAFAKDVPEPQMHAPSGADRAAHGRAGELRAHSAQSGSASASGPQAVSHGRSPLREAIGARALMPQFSFRSQSSTESSHLPSLDLSSFQGVEPGAVARPTSPASPVDRAVPPTIAFDELADLSLSGGSQRQATPDTASTQDSSQPWSWSSWGQSESRSTSSGPLSAASLASLAWLPSMSSFSGASPSPLSGDFDAGLPSRDDLVACRRILLLRDCPGLSAADRLLRDWALARVSSYLDGSRQLPFIQRDEIQLLARVSAAMTRKNMALPRDAAVEIDDPTRSPQSRQALTEIADWVDAARGAEGVRRERWLQYLTDRSFDPEARLLLPAELLLRGRPLPPESAMSTLLPADTLTDRGTLRWRGQVLMASTPLAALLDRLGVRHLDLVATQLTPDGPLRGLGSADISAATLHQTRGLAPSSLRERIQELADTLPALYLVRLADQRWGIDRAAIPPGWSPDAQVQGQLRHLRRDANRKRMEPVRGLWPGGRMPPSLRAQSVNVPPDGEPVLDYIGRVRQQRAAIGQFGRADVALCAHLLTIIDGMSRDVAFAARCRDMAQNPAGPCADGGTLTLSAMSALRDASEATTVEEVAQNAFVQACLARASADRAERRPDFDETVEDAMVLRWHVSRALAELLGADRVRVGDKPVFGAYVEGTDWDSSERRAAFEAEARALVAREAEEGFPGVVMLFSVEDDPLGSAFQSRVDQALDGAGFDQQRAAARDAYERAVEDGEDAIEASLRTDAELKRIGEAHHERRLALLRPGLDELRQRIEATWP